MNGAVETYLRNQHDNDHDQADPRSGHAKDGPERNLVESVAVVFPCVPETNVGKANAAPGEERGQTGKRLEPVEGDGSTGVKSHEGERRPREDEDGGPQRSAGTVNVSEELGSVTLLGESAQCSGSTVDTRETDRNN